MQGTGFVGREVAKVALSRGHAVTCLSRRGAPTQTLEGAQFLAGDALDRSVVESAMQGCDTVVHALGLLFDVTTPG